jgi:hypothetical protein
VLKKPLNDAAACLQHPAECELQSERAKDPASKQSLRDLAAQWRRIAETYEYIERVDISYRSQGRNFTSNLGMKDNGPAGIGGPAQKA